ncbi:hypothetical protein [Actinomyces respiraculi]|uniref:hypothetical protein n=1 Tax=Actinomyces respiraculi TaxID=2744574 RepID=UPI00141F4F8C|nr:hypothetical protein [Actinomyces respiraculi]
MTTAVAAEAAAPLRAGAAGAPAAGAPAAGAPSRLAAARTALAQAEARTGLRTLLPTGARPAAPVGVSASASGARAAALPAPALAPSEPAPEAVGPWEAIGLATIGSLSLTGSMTLLLAAAARRQGLRGWCAVVGGKDLCWCAAAELGLDLSRVLVVPTRDLAPASLPAVLAALVDGLDVVLLTDGIARLLTARQQRTIAARARERGCLVLLDEPWEGTRLLQARALGGTRLADAGREAEGGDAVVPRVEGARVLPLRPGQERAQAPVEMPEGYLQHLDWALTEPQRGRADTLLRCGPHGVHTLTAQAPQQAHWPEPALTVLPGGLP